jgi:hypothetical protein
VERNREGAEQLAENLAGYALWQVRVEFLAGSDACPTCLALNGREFDPQEAPAIPLVGCRSEFCRCDYGPVWVDGVSGT